VGIEQCDVLTLYVGQVGFNNDITTRSSIYYIKRYSCDIYMVVILIMHCLVVIKTILSPVCKVVPYGILLPSFRSCHSLI